MMSAPSCTKCRLPPSYVALASLSLWRSPLSHSSVEDAAREMKRSGDRHDLRWGGSANSYRVSAQCQLTVTKREAARAVAVAVVAVQMSCP